MAILAQQKLEEKCQKEEERRKQDLQTQQEKIELERVRKEAKEKK